MDEFGRYQVEQLNYGDIWYFPKGAAHTIQGLGDENEYLLVFDDADFDKAGYVLSPGRLARILLTFEQNHLHGR